MSSIRNTPRGRRNHRHRDSIGKRDVRDRSRGHRGTIRRDRREATTGRRGIKIEITSRTQGGACNGWIASPTLSPFLASVSTRRVASRDFTRPKIIADDDPHRRPSMKRIIYLTRKRVVERSLLRPRSRERDRRGSRFSPPLSYFSFTDISFFSRCIVFNRALSPTFLFTFP